MSRVWEGGAGFLGKPGEGQLISERLPGLKRGVSGEGVEGSGDT